MQEISGSTNIKISVLDIYFKCMLKDYEPLFLSAGFQIAETFYDLCRLFYAQNCVSINPQTEFYIPQEAWKGYFDEQKEENLITLKDFGCIDYEDRVRVLPLGNTDTPTKIRVYKINNKILSLLLKFAEKIYNKANFANVEYRQ